MDCTGVLYHADMFDCGPGDVHDVDIWAVHLRGSDEDVARCLAAVSDGERERAERFRFEHLRRAFLLAHGCLRMLLGRYLRTAGDAAGTEIRFEYGVYGKPRVGSPNTNLRFNLSHSKDLAVFAFAMGSEAPGAEAECELGVDVEAIRPLPDMKELAARFFSREEAEDLSSVAPALRGEAFFAAWTRKEAYIKAVGAGLQIPLDGFRVTLRPDEEARLVHIGGDRDKAGEWNLHSFHPADGYTGAVIYSGPERRISLFPAVDASDLLGCERAPDAR